jgi:hypothetical protein
MIITSALGSGEREQEKRKTSNVTPNMGRNQAPKARIDG